MLYFFCFLGSRLILTPNASAESDSRSVIVRVNLTLIVNKATKNASMQRKTTVIITPFFEFLHFNGVNYSPFSSPAELLSASAAGTDTEPAVNPTSSTAIASGVGVLVGESSV